MHSNYLDHKFNNFTLITTIYRDDAIIDLEKINILYTHEIKLYVFAGAYVLDHLSSKYIVIHILSVKCIFLFAP